MTVTRLQDHTYRIAYGPSDDRVNDFYVPALSASVRYDRSAGFFSSSALAVAAEGVAMSGRRSRDKGNRTERSIVHALQARGFAAVMRWFVGGRAVE